MNIDEALKLAHQGDVESQERVAWCYHIGKGVKKSEKKSFYWSLKAAMSGRSPISSYNVSIAYFNGEGVKSDDKLAFFWAGRSANQGLPDGYFACGIHFLYGYGIKQNTRCAVKYLIRAYKMGDMLEAAKLLAKIYTLGVGIRKSYRKAFYWTSRVAIHSRDSDMFYNLGLFYLNGTGTRKNMLKAFLWTKKSAKYNNIDGMLATGWHYLNGIGICSNTEQAEFWFEKCITASNKCSKAYYNLGHIFLYEYHNSVKAYEFFAKAYRIDRHVASAYELAKMYIELPHRKINFNKAESLLKFAASHGYYRARRLLNSKYFQHRTR